MSQQRAFTFERAQSADLQPSPALTAPGRVARVQTLLGFTTLPPCSVTLIQIITRAGALHPGEVGLESFPLALNEALKEHLIHIPKHC